MRIRPFGLGIVIALVAALAAGAGTLRSSGKAVALYTGVHVDDVAIGR